MEDLLSHKKKLFEMCRDIVSMQIESAQAELKRLQEMEAEETKSSSGDKYETSRAMLHLEKEKVSIRLMEANKKQKTLSQINPERVMQEVGLGSLVKTNRGVYFLAVSLGRETVDAKDVYIISPVSPIGKALIGKRKGEQIAFNASTYEVLDTV